MLGLAAPDVDVPSFEELRAYVRATRTQTASSSLRLYRMGWAASVVLALGAGWMLRGGQMPTQVPARLESIPPAARDDAEALELEEALFAREGEAGRGGAGAVGFVDERGGRADASVVAGGTIVDELTAGGGDVATSVIADAPDLFVRQAVTAPAEPGLAVSQDTGLSLPAELEAAPDLKAQAEARAAEEVVASEVPSQPLETGAGTLTNVAAAVPPGEPDADTVLRRAGDVAQPVPEAQSAARRRAELSPLEAAPRPGALLEGRRPDQPEVDEDDGAALGVPGLEVVYIEALGGSTPGGVHVLQRYGADQLVDVYRIPADVDPTDLLPPASGLIEVRRRLEAGEWVILRGALTETELRDLLSRFDPEG
jgi:hypothetical protein